MIKERPDHHDAELMLKVYDLRRETVMRASRDAINAKFWPKTADDVLALMQPGHELNAPLRQVGGYWEMVYNMARRGIVNPDYWVEGNTEGLFVFAKFEPFLDAIRKEVPSAFQNTEWIATKCDAGRDIFARIRERVKRFAATR